MLYVSPRSPYGRDQCIICVVAITVTARASQIKQLCVRGKPVVVYNQARKGERQQHHFIPNRIRLTATTTMSTAAQVRLILSSAPFRTSDIILRTNVQTRIAQTTRYPARLAAHQWLANSAEVGQFKSQVWTALTRLLPSLGRKLKCDGIRPSCSNCNRRGVPCAYVPV